MLAKTAPCRLLPAALAGDTRAWTELVRRYEGVIRSAARAHGFRGTEADDVVQTTWMRLFEHGDRLREPAALPGWLRTTARRECIRMRTATLPELPVDPGDLPERRAPVELEGELLADERRRALRRALVSLNGRQRMVVETLIGEPEPNYRDVAAQLGMPLGSVGPTLVRGLAALRRHGALEALADREAVTPAGRPSLRATSP